MSAQTDGPILGVSATMTLAPSRATYALARAIPGRRQSGTQLCLPVFRAFGCPQAVTSAKLANASCRRCQPASEPGRPNLNQRLLFESPDRMCWSARNCHNACACGVVVSANRSVRPTKVRSAATSVCSNRRPASNNRLRCPRATPNRSGRGAGGRLGPVTDHGPSN